MRNALRGISAEKTSEKGRKEWLEIGPQKGHLRLQFVQIKSPTLRGSKIHKLESLHRAIGDAESLVTRCCDASHYEWCQPIEFSVCQAPPRGFAHSWCPFPSSSLQAWHNMNSISVGSQSLICRRSSVKSQKIIGSLTSRVSPCRADQIEEPQRQRLTVARTRLQHLQNVSPYIEGTLVPSNIIICDLGVLALSRCMHASYAMDSQWPKAHIIWLCRACAQYHPIWCKHRQGHPKDKKPSPRSR